MVVSVHAHQQSDLVMYVGLGLDTRVYPLLKF